MEKKIFEGVVNGTKFDNKEDFDAAVQSAIASGSELSISSRYETVYVDDDAKHDYMLEDPDQHNQDLDLKALTPEDGNFTILPAALQERVCKASNKKEIKAELRSLIGGLEDEITGYEKTINDLKSKSDSYLEEIRKVNEQMSSMKNVKSVAREKLAYYNRLKSVVDEENATNLNDQKIHTFDLGVGGIVSDFSKFLNDVGFLSF